MKKFLFFIVVFIISGCYVYKPTEIIADKNLKSFRNADFTIAFGSGNKQEEINPFWNQILKQSPNVWIWGGDNIYCDTEDMTTLANCYAKQKHNKSYQNFKANIDVIGVWDDHDYGVNDGGAEYPQKQVSQSLFLDFMDVPSNDVRRMQKGTYYIKDYNIGNNKIKIILLDTRYFRSALIEDTDTRKRYKPNMDNNGTILGDEQWKWLNTTLNESKADYNIIVSSIQFLSNQHGFEAWGNFPNEVLKMENMIVSSGANRVVILSGDRHISEVSSKDIGKGNYQLLDFTSSGLTHAYTRFTSEYNPFRVSKVIHQKSYGLVKFDFSNEKLVFEIWGEDNELLVSYSSKVGDYKKN